MMYKLARYDRDKKLELDSCILGRRELLIKLDLILWYNSKLRAQVQKELKDLKCSEDAIWFGVKDSRLDVTYAFQYKITIYKEE